MWVPIFISGIMSSTGYKYTIDIKERNQEEHGFVFLLNLCNVIWIIVNGFLVLDAIALTSVNKETLKFMNS